MFPPVTRVRFIMFEDQPWFIIAGTLSNGLRPIPPPCLGSGSESSGMLLGISSEGSRGPPGGQFCGILGACWGFLGASWRPLGASGGRLGASWGRLGAVSSKGRFVSSLWGPSWGVLVALLGRLGGLLARLGGVLGRLGALLGAS